MQIITIRNYSNTFSHISASPYPATPNPQKNLIRKSGNILEHFIPLSHKQLTIQHENLNIWFAPQIWEQNQPKLCENRLLSMKKTTNNNKTQQSPTFLTN